MASAPKAYPGHLDPGPHARQQASYLHDRLRLHPAPAGDGAWRLAQHLVHARTAASPSPASPSPAGTPASSPSPASTAVGPRPASTPAYAAYQAEPPAAATTNGPSREVLGFAPYRELSTAGGWDLGTLSAIAYFGLDVRSDGSFDTSSSNPGYQGWTGQEFASLVAAAHQHGVRVLLVVEQLDPATVNAIVTNPAAISAAAANTVSAIQSMGLDGVDVDLEGTSQGYPNARSGMVAFMAQVSQSVRQSLPSAEILIDTYTGSAGCDTCFFDIPGIAPYVDAFDVMAYDMAQSNTPGQAGPNAPLNGWTYNDTAAVSQYLAALGDPSKVVLGVPYYGYKWSTISNQPYASITGGEESDTYADLVSEFGCMEQLSRWWDATGASPWASWWSPGTNDPCGGNWNSWRETYYDDADSLGLKYDLVNAKGLRGVGIWALGYDAGTWDLSNEIALKFKGNATRPQGFSNVTGTPAFIQSRFGSRGNFELVAPLTGGGMEHAWRNNDAPGMPWTMDTIFGQSLGQVDAVSLIQSNYGSPGNLEVIARSGSNLYAFWRDSGPEFIWHGPQFITSGVSGVPALIQSRFGSQGNFEVVTPLASGGLEHLWRNNDDPALPWHVGAVFGQDLGQVQAVSLIESNFGSPGNLELIARSGNNLYAFWRDSGPGFVWHETGEILNGARGNPVMIQGRYGSRGNFELVTPTTSGGLAHMWRNNDAPDLPWSQIIPFGESLGQVDAVSLIESNYGDPGNLEVIARTGNVLWTFYRDSYSPYQWHGPL